MPTIVAEENTVRDQLLKLANDLPCLANARSKPESVVLAEAKRVAVFSGGAGMATIPEEVLRGRDPDSGDSLRLSATFPTMQ